MITFVLLFDTFGQVCALRRRVFFFLFNMTKGIPVLRVLVRGEEVDLRMPNTTFRVGNSVNYPGSAVNASLG